ncbi:major facilitator superfamily MFS_1 [Sulfobacillus acidophilus TPY]|uniref:Major facilitator superfamily MFS_1 n=1 Tax=Sulfobacillus acidophilus (strain ATCC 700253 / DSM 10332 / NAL) TaxID=679936 RepID=G8TZA2_SULAD|nr:major facilitator superfamily MFS_1 [Sulfobacillus acidophilus TPY]AEW04071.1 major facilitator superfamily MFS_1 [Sulfobacillus acidophilus DSM 10332]
MKASNAPTTARPSVSRKHVIVLTSSAAVLYVLIEMVSGFSAIVTARVVGSPAVAGLGPAIVFGLAGMTSVPAGWLSDRVGRRPLLSGGFFIGGLGALAAGLSMGTQTVLWLWAAWILTGMGIGILRLLKAAAADLYPPQARTRGIGVVQTGALLGAYLGMAVATGRSPQATMRMLADPWFLVAILWIMGMIGTWGLLRPDPIQMAHAWETDQDVPHRSVLPRTGHRRIGAILLAISVIYGVMVMDMALAGEVLKQMGAGSRTIMIVMAVHFTGMFGPMRWAGGWATRTPRPRMALMGAVAMIAATATMAIVSLTPLTISISLFVVGVGWCIAWMAGLGELAEAVPPRERGTIMGMADFGSDIVAAIITLFGGVTLAHYHLTGLVILGVSAGGIAMGTIAWGWPTRRAKISADPI